MMSWLDTVMGLAANSNRKLLEPRLPRLSALLPYQAFDEAEGIYINDNSYGFLLEVTPLCGASQEIVNTLTGMFTDGVPEGCTIQIMNWASPKVGQILAKWQESRVGEVYQSLARRRIEYYSDKNWQSFFNTPYCLRDFRLFIAVAVPASKGLIGKKLLTVLKSQLQTTLKTSGMQSVEMRPDSFLNLIEELLNPNYDLFSPKLRWNKIDPLKDHISNYEQSVQITPNEIILESDKSFALRSFTVRNFPEVWAQWNNRDLIGDFESDYLRIPCPFLTVFSFVYGNENKESSKANFNLIRSTQKAGSGFARFMPSVHEVEKDWKFVVDKLQKGQKLVHAFYQVIIYAPLPEIESCERYVNSLYRSKSWHLVRDKYVQMQNWLAALPFTLSEGLSDDLRIMGRLKSMVTWSCANIAPLQGEWKGHKSPRMMLIGKRGQPFFWDPFENDGNYNVAVVGRSGSGKSVFMQELVSSFLGAGGQVIVIDDGRSFMNSCIRQNGVFIEFSGAKPVCLNPFSIVSEKTFEKNKEYKGDVLQLLNLIIRQMCRSVELASDIENAFIAESISFVWERYKRNGTVSQVADYLLKHKDKRAQDLGLMLHPFTKDGLYSDFFEGAAEIDLDKAFFVFEFAEIKNKPDLQRIVLMVLIFLVSEKMFYSDRSKTVSLVIDEAWSLLHGSHFGQFIEGIARRARKYTGNLITGTQSMDDYYKNSAAEAAIQNTDWFCLLAQKDESIEAIKKTGRISIKSAEMEQALKGLTMSDNQYSEVMIYGPQGWAIGRLVLDSFSIALYSSKGDNFAKIKALQEQGLSLEAALEQASQQINNGR